MLIKSRLRTELIARRCALDVDDWADRCDRICQHLAQVEVVRSASQLLTYRSIRREPDLTGLTLRLASRWGLPRCVGSELAWHLWRPELAEVEADRLRLGPFGIEEPAEDWPMLGPVPGTVLLVPAVACDRRGYRLGYGGGFYDRLFAQEGWTGLVKIGIVFEFAILDQLPTDPWDIRLDMICCEAGVVDVRSAS